MKTLTEELVTALRDCVAALEAAGADGEPGDMPAPALDNARLLLERIDEEKWPDLHFGRMLTTREHLELVARARSIQDRLLRVPMTDEEQEPLRAELAALQHRTGT